MDAPATNDFIIFVNELYCVEKIDRKEAALRPYHRQHRGGNLFVPAAEVCEVPVAFLLHDFPYRIAQVTHPSVGQGVRLEPQQARRVA